MEDAGRDIADRQHLVNDTAQVGRMRLEEGQAGFGDLVEGGILETSRHTQEHDLGLLLLAEGAGHALQVRELAEFADIDGNKAIGAAADANQQTQDRKE